MYGLEYRTTGSGGALTLEAIYHDEGRITPNGASYQYEYSVKDHLGNTRITFADLNANAVVDVPGDILQENHYYPVGMNMNYGWLNNTGQIDSRYQYNGKELNDDFGVNWSDYGARWYDAAVGRWWSVDLLFARYPTLSPYNFTINNPLVFIDPDGLQIVDPKGREVKVERDKNGALQYQFNEKTKAKHQKQFMKESAPVLEAMNGSEKGYQDIQQLSSLDSKVSIIGSTSSNENANSEITPLVDNKGNPVLLGNGQYAEATITVFLGNYEKNSTADKNEWLGSVMTVETGHLDPAQIKLEMAGYSNNPSDPVFTTVYQGLLNRAVSFRAAYRTEKGQAVTSDVFDPIEKVNARGAKIQYAPENKRLKDQIDNNK